VEINTVTLEIPKIKKEGTFMVKIQRSIEIKAPLQEVYAYLSNPQNEPEWMAGMQEIHNLTGSGIGTHFDWTYKMGGLSFKGESTRLEDDRERHFVAKTKGGVESTWTFNMERRSDEATVLKLEIEYAIPVPLLGTLVEMILSKRNERDMDLSISNIKQRLEARVPTWIGAERRTEKRARVDLPCYVEGVSQGRETREKAQVVDLSRLGMFVEADEPLDEGTHVNSRINTRKYGNTFWLKGWVIRSTPRGMAIRFGEKAPRKIERLLESGQ